MTFGKGIPNDITELREILIETGRIDSSATLTRLTGGVSSIVALVEGTDEPWVVKVPMERLAVPDEWIVDRSRGANEAAILQFLNGGSGPLRCPRPRFFDSNWTILGEELIAGPVPTYKDELLAGNCHLELAGLLGAATAELHRLKPPEALSGDGPRQLFDALRLDPYYRVTAGRSPVHGKCLTELINETVTALPRSLVHGDLTPKNILVTDDGPVFLDWEVVHVGDSAFDLGTITAHLMLKAIRHHPTGGAAPIIEAAGRFWEAYDGPADRARGLRHAGAVMLARLYGKSPVEYLEDRAARLRAQELAEVALAGQMKEFEDMSEVVSNILKNSVR